MFPDPLPPGFMVTLLGVLLGLVVICIILSYYIARSRWRTMMELRERHSPSKTPDNDEVW